MEKASLVYILLGAALWGIIGLFVDGLRQYGYTVIEIVALRVLVASVIMLLYILYHDQKLLKVKWRDTKYFIGTGVFSIVFFNWSYFTAINEMSLSIAVILLYTSPAFVIILARIFFKEPITSTKAIALVMTIVGCAFVVNVFSLGNTQINVYGMIVGLGSGFGYALYSIFGKYALRKYHTMTVTLYTFLFAGAALLPFMPWTRIMSGPEVGEWLYIIGLGLVPTVLAYLFYTHGLVHVESGKAAVAATVEPVVATIIGVALFGERLSVIQIIGIVFVLLAVLVVQDRKRLKMGKNKEKKAEPMHT